MPSAQHGIVGPPSKWRSMAGMCSPSVRPSAYTGSITRWTPALSRHGHACPFRAGTCQGARGAGGKRGRSHGRGGEILYSNACHFPCDCSVQLRAQDKTRRRIVIRPSHNPPHDGAFKCNSPNGVPVQQAMRKVQQPADSTTRHAYSVAVSADRPLANYTPRVVPDFDGATMPLEEERLLWQKRVL